VICLLLYLTGNYILYLKIFNILNYIWYTKSYFLFVLFASFSRVQSRLMNRRKRNKELYISFEFKLQEYILYFTFKTKYIDLYKNIKPYLNQYLQKEFLSRTYSTSHVICIWVWKINVYNQKFGYFYYYTTFFKFNSRYPFDAII